MEKTQSVKMVNVSKLYYGKGNPYRALNNVSINFQSGELTAIIGKSGSGKTTLLNLITGIDSANSGKVFINDTDIQNLSESEKAVFRRNTIGVVFQFFQLMPTLSVIDNVLLPMEFGSRYSKKQMESIAYQKLETVGIAEHAMKYPSQLSGGEQQRTAIARALANDPSIIIADEPTGNLDSRTSDKIVNLFHSLAGLNKTIIMVTHDREMAADVDRVVTIADGEVVSDELVN